MTYQAASDNVTFVGAGARGANSFELVATTTSPSPFSFGDRFATNNNFNGGQIGARADFAAGSWFANITGKVAFGTMRETIDVTGSNTAFPRFVPTLGNGGIYAQQSNIGNHSQGIFAVAPEVTANMGWRLTSWMKASVGYSFFFVNNVVRPGDQMQNTLDVTRVFTGMPGSVPSSASLFNQSSFWAQGLNFSLEFQY